MNKFTKSKSALFLMELVIVILFFSICAAVCMQLFVQTHLLGQKTSELNNSVTAAQGVAEVVRGTDGSIDTLMKYYPAAVTDGEHYMEIYYNDAFDLCDYADAQYACKVTMVDEMYIRNLDISVSRISDGDNIYSLNASKYTGYIND